MCDGDLPVAAFLVVQCCLADAPMLVVLTFRRWSARRWVGALEPGREGKGFPSVATTSWRMRGANVLVELCHGGAGLPLAVSSFCVSLPYSLRLAAWSVPAAVSMGCPLVCGGVRAGSSCCFSKFLRSCSRVSRSTF